MQNRRRSSNNRAKTCRFTEQKVNYIDFMDVDILNRFTTEGGRILPRRITGVSRQYQNLLTKAVKRARNLALIK